MGFHERYIGPQEKAAIKADQFVPHPEKAKGSKVDVEKIFTTPHAVAIRNEIKKYASALAKADDLDKYDVLEKLARDLKAYSVINLPEDEDERAAYIQALVDHEKGLH